MDAMGNSAEKPLSEENAEQSAETVNLNQSKTNNEAMSDKSIELKVVTNSDEEENAISLIQKNEEKFEIL